MPAPGPLRRLLLSGIISGAVVVLATPLSTLVAESPDPVVTVAPGPPGNAQGEDAIAEKGSMASGHDTSIEGDAFLGPTPAEVKAIIWRTLSAADLQTLVREAARGALLETDTRVRELGAELDVRDEALARMLEILGRQDVPPERLADVLAEIVARHKSLLERVRLLEASDPRAAELRDAVAAAIETADYDRVDALLAEADAIQIEAMRQLLEALDRRVLNAAALYPEAGDVTRTRLEYGRAAELAALLHGYGWASSEASPRCDRRPDHPRCNDDDDDRSCEKRPDHPRCNEGPPPSPS